MVLATSISKAAVRRRLVLGSGGGGGTCTPASSSSAPTSTSCRRHSIPSFGFSGAGFLTCYHLGVVDCLIKNGILLKSSSLPTEESSPIMTGVSGGALTVAAVAVGITPEDGMNAINEIVQRTRDVGGIMDHLRPGFSLIDQVEDLLLQLTRDVDDEFVLRRIRSHPIHRHHNEVGNIRLLRIGLTDSSYVPSLAYIYVDDFKSVDEIIASCILSSYVPGLTGPAISASSSSSSLNKLNRRNGAVRRATRHLNKMLQRGSIKDKNGIPIYSLQNPTNGTFWDGGLANVFPVIDSNTTLVTPFCGTFRNNSISPSPSSSSSLSLQRQQSSSHHKEDTGGMFRWWKLRRRMSSLLLTKSFLSESYHHRMNNAKLDLSLKNINALRRIAFSSDYEILESWFEDGYNDALKYLKTTGHDEASIVSPFSSTIRASNASVTTSNVGNNSSILSPLSQEVQTKPQSSSTSSSSAEMMAQ